jgi:hypothetical protein
MKSPSVSRMSRCSDLRGSIDVQTVALSYIPALRRLDVQTNSHLTRSISHTSGVDGNGPDCLRGTLKGEEEVGTAPSTEGVMAHHSRTRLCARRV